MRQMLWGILVAVAITASPSLRAAEPEPVISSGGLPREAIQKVINTNRNAIRTCYERRLAESPVLTGKVLVKWTIDAGGLVSVVGVTKEGSTIDDAKLLACITKQIKTWKFPKPSGGILVEVNYPFIFKAASEADDRKGKGEEAKLANVAADAAKPAELEAVAKSAAPAAPAPTGEKTDSRSAGGGKASHTEGIGSIDVTVGGAGGRGTLGTAAAPPAPPSPTLAPTTPAPAVRASKAKAKKDTPAAEPAGDALYEKEPTRERTTIKRRTSSPASWPRTNPWWCTRSTSASACSSRSWTQAARASPTAPWR